MAEADGNEYYDLMLIGRTGMGMTTLGNKLAVAPESLAAASTSELLVNDKAKLRVLDVPGLPDSGITSQSGQRISACVRKLQLFCWIVQMYRDEDLRVRRVIYFLPARGPPEKADGNLQEELEVMYRFFGRDIFDCMVVAATKQRKYQDLEFDEKELEQTKTVLDVALKGAISDEEISSPPVIYIGIDESEMEVINKIKAADVLHTKMLTLTQDFFHDRSCLRCSIKTRFNQKGEMLAVLDDTGTLIPYDESKCHPQQFIEKYARWQKVLGTIFHILALGLYYFYKTEYKGENFDNVLPPILTSTNQVCPACRNPPGSPGCKEVNESVDCDWIPGFATTQVRINHEY